MLALDGESATVKVAVDVPLSPSAIFGRSLIDSVGVGGAASSLVIVPRPCASEMVALVGLVRLTKKDSVGSNVASPLTKTVTGFAVSPGLNVKVPLVD